MSHTRRLGIALGGLSLVAMFGCSVELSGDDAEHYIQPFADIAIGPAAGAAGEESTSGNTSPALLRPLTDHANAFPRRAIGRNGIARGEGCAVLPGTRIAADHRYTTVIPPKPGFFRLVPCAGSSDAR